MGLAQVVASNPPAPGRTGTPCSVGHLLNTLNGDDQDALLLILYGEERQRGGRGRPASEVFRLVTAAGHDVSQQQINRHRSGACRCGGAA
jgi:hypothetical protein